jgi:hypothetical protein
MLPLFTSASETNLLTLESSEANLFLPQNRRRRSMLLLILCTLQRS